MNTRLITLCLIVFALAMFRLIPHLPNVSPIAAMALFGGAYLADKKIALIIPFLALLLSDAIIGFHSTMVFVYFSFALTVGIGYWMSRSINFSNVAVATIVSSVLFFLITNFGAWMSHGLYPKTFDGLVQAYVAGIPFFQNTLLGNVFYSAVVFGGFLLVQKYMSRTPKVIS